MCVCVSPCLCVCVQGSGVWWGRESHSSGVGAGTGHVNPVALGKCPPSLGFTLAICKVITGFASSFTGKTHCVLGTVLVL